ncbi:MAG: hypothetical protein ACHREM_26245, partial [Polyangiales bacterium]
MPPAARHRAFAPRIDDGLVNQRVMFGATYALGRPFVAQNQETPSIRDLARASTWVLNLLSAANRRFSQPTGRSDTHWLTAQLTTLRLSPPEQPQR